jgi:hypothetical protein
MALVLIKTAYRDEKAPEHKKMKPLALRYRDYILDRKENPYWVYPI